MRHKYFLQEPEISPLRIYSKDTNKKDKKEEAQGPSWEKK